MALLRVWFRIEVRNRWRSLLGLALLLAFVSATVTTALAGASRGASAVDRLAERTVPYTVAVVANEPGFDWEAVAGLPGVEAIAPFSLAAYAIDELPELGAGEPFGFAFTSDAIMRDVDRPVVLEGRLPNPERADELFVSPGFEDVHGFGVGDVLTLRLYTPEQVDQAGPASPLDQALGPAIEARIVGAGRSPWFANTEGEGLATSPGLFAAYEAHLMGASGDMIINALVRLEGGDAGIPAFEEALLDLAGHPIELTRQSTETERLQDVTGFESRSLLAFAAAAAAAAIVLLGQSIVRYVSASMADLYVLHAFGLNRWRVCVAAAVAPSAAALIGAAGGVGAAVLASRWFPIGTAADFEPSPGVHVDAAVVVGVAGLAVVLAGAGAWLSARLALRPRSAMGGQSPIVARISRVTTSVVLNVGAQLALERGAGRQVVPVRSAFVGAVAGTLGTIAALTFSNGVDDAVRHPERFGTTYELTAILGFSDFYIGPPADTLHDVAEDPDVVAVTSARAGSVETGGTTIEVFSHEPIGAAVDIVVTSGHMPSEADEVALAPRAAERVGAEIGDRIRLAGAQAEREVTVSGVAFVPSGPHNDYATGAWANAELYDELFGGFNFHLGLIDLRPGADPAEVAARLGSESGLAIEPAREPKELAELRQVESMPRLLAIFLALLAVGAVGHGLATTVFRRRHDLAALRALGVTPRQTRGIVLTQATIFAIVGTVVGVPLGLVFGRIVWRYVADYTPVAYVSPLALLALTFVAPVALLVAWALAVWPSQRAASMNLARTLRAE